jgi:Na+/H+ antiporter NhaA
VTEQTAQAAPFQGRDARIHSCAAPVREFLRAETGRAVVLVGATVIALVWVNVGRSSYEAVWTANFSIRFGGSGISQDLRQWVNDGLMTFFFLFGALEARRDRPRRASRTAALGGMLMPIGIYCW